MLQKETAKNKEGKYVPVVTHEGNGFICPAYSEYSLTARRALVAAIERHARVVEKTWWREREGLGYGRLYQLAGNKQKKKKKKTKKDGGGRRKQILEKKKETYLNCNFVVFRQVKDAGLSVLQCKRS